MSDIADTQDHAARTIAFWCDIAPPNAAAKEIVGQFFAARDDLAALRGKARFEEEPASFLAALHACKEGAR